MQCKFDFYNKASLIQGSENRSNSIKIYAARYESRRFQNNLIGFKANDDQQIVQSIKLNYIPVLFKIPSNCLKRPKIPIATESVVISDATSFVSAKSPSLA